MNKKYLFDSQRFITLLLVVIVYFVLLHIQKPQTKWTT